MDGGVRKVRAALECILPRVVASFFVFPANLLPAGHGRLQNIIVQSKRWNLPHGVEGPEISDYKMQRDRWKLKLSSEFRMDR